MKNLEKALALPIGICIVLCCVLSLALGPLLRAEPSNVPFAIVNLDKGAITIAGDSNIGETLTENLITGESSLTGDDNEEDADDSFQDAVSWTQLSSEKELMASLDQNGFYGGVVVPSNFTSQEMNAKVGLSDAPEIKVYLNKGKNPQTANAIETTLEEEMLKAGIACDIKMVNDVTLSDGAMSDTLATQMLIMPLMIMTMICSIATSLIFWHKDALGIKKKKNAECAAFVQGILVLALSALVAAFALFIVTTAGGLNLPAGNVFLLCWAGSFCCMLCFVGLCNIALPLGALVAVCTFALGMSTAMLSPEMLPSFWADWIYPWAPQAHIGNGVRSLVYFGQTPNQNDIMPFVWFGIVGVLALVVAAIKAHKSSSQKKVH